MMMMMMMTVMMMMMMTTVMMLMLTMADKTLLSTSLKASRTRKYGSEGRMM
jgi:hypothetical protein